MGFEQDLKRELKNDIDNLLVDDDGLVERMASVFNSGIKRWIMLIYLTAVAVGILVAWSGYQFFTQTDLSNPLFWGVIFMASLNVQGFIKQFIFMEMNRNATMREIKRIEIMLSKRTN